MDISAVVAASPLDSIRTNGLSSTQSSSGTSFSEALSAAMNMVSETNDLQNSASEEEIKFALGESDNAHDLQIAAQKALTALQYTVAIRDKALDAYKEIMNMQI